MLEDLFPLVSPDDPLIGKNHRLFSDVHMVRKMAFRLSKLVPRCLGGDRDDPLG